MYRVRDRRLERDVALKILRPAFTNDPGRLARLEREARALASLNHPNIATIHGLEYVDASAGSREPAVPALFMELVDGPTLADRVAKGRLTIAETVQIARQIVDALDAANEKGIIHRDVKSANIKVRADGAVKTPFVQKPL